MKKRYIPVLTAAANNSLRGFILKLPTDHFRDIPFRYLGYGFALGHVINYFGSSRESDPFHVLGTSYMVGHCLYRLYQVIGPAIEDELGETAVPAGRLCAAAIYDTLIWDLFATMVIPSLVVYWVCWASDSLLNVVLEERDSFIRRWLPVLISVIIFPCMVTPVDTTVDRFMNLLIRPLYDNYERVFNAMFRAPKP